MSDGLWRYFAPVYYGMTDKNRETRAPSGGLSSPVLTLQAGSLQPVFTSVELAQDFAETFYAEEDPIRPKVGPVDAFLLARTVDLSEEVGVRDLVFDPVATSVGQLACPLVTMPLSYYRRFVAELDSGLEKLFARACAELGYGPEGPLRTPWGGGEVGWVQDWCWARVDEVVEDARARASEWERSGADPQPN